MTGSFLFAKCFNSYISSLQDNKLLDLETLIQECDSLAEKEEIADNDKELRILEDLLTRVSLLILIFWFYIMYMLPIIQWQ